MLPRTVNPVQARTPFVHGSHLLHVLLVEDFLRGDELDDPPALLVERGGLCFLRRSLTGHSGQCTQRGEDGKATTIPAPLVPAVKEGGKPTKIWADEVGRRVGRRFARRAPPGYARFLFVGRLGFGGSSINIRRAHAASYALTNCPLEQPSLSAVQMCGWFRFLSTRPRWRPPRKTV